MNPEHPEAPPTVLDHIVWFFIGLSPGQMLIVAGILLALALWMAWIGWPHLCIIDAIKSTPAATSSAVRSGLVKLSGRAHPTAEHAQYVWFKSEKLDERAVPGMRSTGMYSVDPILIRDASGDCAINPQEAVVVPTLVKSDIKKHFLASSATYISEKAILPGDPIFALGEIHRGQDPTAAGGSCRLRKAAGVLLVSGKSEAQTLRRFRLYFWSELVALVLCLGAAAWGFHTHLQGYQSETLGEFVEVLKTRPWEKGPH